MKILHITPHLGGGVGDTILGYLSVNQKDNTIVSLGYALNHRKDIGVPHYYDMADKHDKIIEMIPEFDIVLIHWWNHPLLYDFLVRNDLPGCRLIIWSHNSGLYIPNIYTKKIVNYPDILVFTSPLSYGVKNVLESNVKKYNIWSTGGIKDYLSLEKEPHDNFVIGYVGTVDYAKMHPNYLDMCRKINIPNVEFIVLGDSDLIKDEVDDRFTLPGFVNDLKEWYSKFDVFGYPLNPTHYGTCDLVLQMAMASGTPPIVLNNPMERTFIEDGIDGLIAEDEEEYVNMIRLLHEYPKIRKKLSNYSRKTAKSRFSLKKLNDKWMKVFEEVMDSPKKRRRWGIDKDVITGKDIFLESLGEYGKPFVDDDEEKIKEMGKEYNWKSETKGTVHNYAFYFEDETLKKWSKLMRQ